MLALTCLTDLFLIDSILLITSLLLCPLCSDHILTHILHCHVFIHCPVFLKIFLLCNNVTKLISLFFHLLDIDTSSKTCFIIPSISLIRASNCISSLSYLLILSIHLLFLLHPIV